MARQTLLSFLGAGKGKKEEKEEEKESRAKESFFDRKNRSDVENTLDKEDAQSQENAGDQKDPLHMVDVEEDIFSDIPEKGEKVEKSSGGRQSVFEKMKAAGRKDRSERQSKEQQDSDFSNGWWNTEKPKMEPEEKGRGFGRPKEESQEEGWGFERPEEERKAENQTLGDFFQDIIEPEYEVEKTKSIYFEIVLDKTISMAKIYRPIYKKLEKMIDNMDRAMRNYQKKGQVGLKWGLTLITEEEPEIVKFNESYFTASPDRMKHALKEFQFEGGSGNGHENINEALTAAIRTLSQESQGEGRCGLILLTDSLPEEEDMEPDFEYLEHVEHTELCFAHCFVYNCEAYTPYFNMVDGEGETDVKGIHYLEIRDLDAFLNREADNLTEKLLKKLLHQTSIS